MQTQFAMAESYWNCQKTSETECTDQAAREFNARGRIVGECRQSIYRPRNPCSCGVFTGWADAGRCRGHQGRRIAAAAVPGRIDSLLDRHWQLCRYRICIQGPVALIYEAQKEPEIAAQEFVKLAQVPGVRASGNGDGSSGNAFSA